MLSCKRMTRGGVIVAGLVGAADLAQAETRVTYKSAKAGTSYYQMGVQIAEAVKAASGGGIIVTVEESQGSTQNVMEARVRGADYVFTSPPALIDAAQTGKELFEGKQDPKFADIRALFPIPSLTMHFVVSKASGVKDIAGLKDKTILLGKGSFGATEGEKYLKLFGLEGKVKIADAELSNADDALKNGQIDGFVTASSYPAPNVIEAAASTGVTILSLNDDQIELTKRAKLIIPAGTYAGQDAEISTTSLPVVAYATTAMPEEAAYALTKAFWEQKRKMGESAPWWSGVGEALLANITGKVHAGALKYYAEIGYKISSHQK